MLYQVQPMPTRIEDFVNIENGISAKLESTWETVVIDLITEIQKYVTDKNWEKARATAHSLNASSVFDKNMQYFKYSTYAALFFGASRLTKDLKKTIITKGGFDNIVNAAMNLAKITIEKNLVDLAVDKLVVIINNLENASKASSTNIIKAEKRRLAQEFVSFKATGDDMLQLVSSLNTSRVSAYGFTAEAQVLGVEFYRINEQLDNRICPVCSEMHGKVFNVSDARDSLTTILNAPNPDDLKHLQPWPSQSKDSVTEIKNLSSDQLVSRNLHIPPYHPGPVSEDTEFLSDTGWKLVKDATTDDLAFSLNPTNGQVEWVAIVDVISAGKPPNERMVNFKSQNTDLLVTEYHDQVFIETLYKTSKLSVRKAGELLAYTKVTIPRTGNWIGISSGLPTDFIKLLALWISDGSCIKKGENSYYISISTKKYQALAKDLLESITGGSAYVRDTRVECNNTELGKFLMEHIGVGCLGKKIPDCVMGGTVAEITLFLNTYLIGDGAITSTNGKYGSSKNKVFFTTSSTLSAQLSELIVKAGGFPSYIHQDNTLSPQYINGRKIESKNIVHRIRWCTSKNATFGVNGKGTMQFVPYDSNTYCITLEKNHVFYIRRNGKCIWTGNCRGLLVHVDDISTLINPNIGGGLGGALVDYIANIDSFKSLGVNVDLAKLEYWNTYLQIDPAVYIGAITDNTPLELLDYVYNDVANGYKAYGVTNFDIGKTDVTLSATTKMYDTESAVKSKYIYNAVDKEFKVIYVEMAEEDQGKGVLKKLLNDMSTLWEQLGVEKVTLSANIDMGAYAWGKYGWVPKQDSWDILRKNFLPIRIAPLKGNIPDKTYTTIQTLIEMDNPKALWQLVDLTEQHNGESIGKYLLRGQYWQGILDINDTQAITRFKSSIG